MSQANQFGGPGSGRHPEGGSKKDSGDQKISSSTKVAMQQARDVLASHAPDTPNLVKEYINEAEHQDGNSTWKDNYSTTKDITQDFDLYKSIYEGTPPKEPSKASEITYLDSKGNPTDPSRAVTVRVEKDGVVAFSDAAFAFGGPGSGRHPEGGSKDNTSGLNKADQAFVNDAAQVPDHMLQDIDENTSNSELNDIVDSALFDGSYSVAQSIADTYGMGKGQEPLSARGSKVLDAVKAEMKSQVTNVRRFMKENA